MTGGAAPGEIDLNNPDPATQYETARIMAWFDHYMKDLPADTGPEFSYFRDWISYSGNASPAYASAPAFPAGTATALPLAGGAQVDDGGDGSLHVRGVTGEEVGAVAARAGVALLELATRAGSLEQAYLTLTADAVEHRSSTGRAAEHAAAGSTR